MSTPAISVLLPAYNAAEFVAAAIESILAQTRGDFELLVLDDGSTDATPQIVAGFRDPRLRVLKNERNLGLTATLNRGLREARGEFIARQDADDRAHPERFAKQLAAFRERPELLLLGTAAEQVDAHGRSLGALDMPLTPLAMRWAMLFDNPLLHTAVMFRREPVLAEFGGYDESFAISQDYELWSRIARKDAAANLPDRLLTLRAHVGSLMRSRREQTDAETRRIQSAALAAEFPGLALSERERLLIEQFRWQVESAGVDEFWAVFEKLLAAFLAQHPGARRDSDFRATLCAQAARVGYNLLTTDRIAGLSALMRAIRVSPSAAVHLPWPRIAALALLGDRARALHELIFAAGK